jgi:hypothetical protein
MAVRRAGLVPAQRCFSMFITITEAAAVLCQFIQHTDPRFPLIYFTVVSGVLFGAAAAVTVAGRQKGLDIIRIAAAVGVSLSAVVFTLVIAPASPSGTWFQPWDDAWVRTATALFHGVAPLLVITDLVIRPVALSRRAWICAAYGWPALYVVFISLAAAKSSFTVPYPFLSPARMGWGTVLDALGAMTAVIGLCTLLLFLASKAGRRLAQKARGPHGVEEA